jgi:hypothetical protein
VRVSDETSNSLQDPKPKYEGDWSKASGQERQAHMTRVAKWKARNGIPSGAKGKPESGEGVQAPQPGMVSLDAERARDLHDLQAVINGPKSLASDRIRAIESKQRILQRVEEEQAQQEYGELLALRQALDALPEGERVQALHALLVVSDTPHA